MSYKFNPFSGNFDIVGSASGGTGDPGGSNTQVQFNDGGAFGGDSTFTFNKTTDTLTVANLGTTGNVTLGDASGDTVALQAGTAALPTLIPNGDPNTGLWFPAADTIAASTAGSERLRIDSSGNLGLGVTPSAWGSRAFDLGLYASFSSISGADISFNAYHNGGWKYKTTDAASWYSAQFGQHVWSTAPSGTAGAAITFTQAMTLGADNNLLIGSTTSLSAGFRLQVTGNGGTISHVTSTGANGFRFNNTGAPYEWNFGTYAPGISDTGDFMSICRYASGGTWAEFVHITNAGNVGIGTSTFGTSAATVLGIKTGTAPTTGPADTIQLYSTDLSAGNTIPSIYTEGTGIVSSNTGTTNLSNRIAIRVNGTVYYLLAASAA